MSKSVITEIKINAPIEIVWDILEDFKTYKEWNTFCIDVETTKEIGSPFVMTIQWTEKHKPFRQPETFSVYEPPHTVGWSLDWGIWLKTHRVQTLTKIDDETTHYWTEDKFWGLITPLVMALYGKKTLHGFEVVAKALKERAESRYSEIKKT
ncbi:MAG: SRPBCC domain-containing protein [Bacteroidota bacterium]